MTPDRLLKRRDLLARLSISRGVLQKLLDTGDFPPPVRIGPGALRWRESEFTEWLACLPPQTTV